MTRPTPNGRRPGSQAKNVRVAVARDRAAGLTYAQIATKHHVAERTVKVYLHWARTGRAHRLNLNVDEVRVLLAALKASTPPVSDWSPWESLVRRLELLGKTKAFTRRLPP